MSERYDPLPELHLIPAWLWRRASPVARVAFVGVLLIAAGSAIVLVPDIQQSKRETARREAAERRATQAERIRALRAEQRVIRRRATAPPPPGTARMVRIAARERLLGEIEARILTDARGRRLSGRVRRVSCNPFPRTVGGLDPRQDLRRRSGRYQCLAVTAEIRPTRRTPPASSAIRIAC